MFKDLIVIGLIGLPIYLAAISLIYSTSCSTIPVSRTAMPSTG